MLLKAAFATAFIVIAAACDKSAGDIASIETGAWYDTSFNGGRYFVKLDELSVEDRSASGCCYEDNGSGVAQPQDFTAKLSRNKVVLECGGETRKFRTAQLSWKRYEAPQFKKADTSLFRAPFCEVKVTKDIKYGRAEGYWTSLKGVEAEVSKAFTEGAGLRATASSITSFKIEDWIRIAWFSLTRLITGKMFRTRCFVFAETKMIGA